MPDDYEFSRVLLLAVDAWRYGPRDDRQQFELQRHLAEALSMAAARSGLDRSDWRIQDAGDGLLGLLPDTVSEPVLVDPFIRELDTWLSRHNHDRVPGARLRLRVAVHHGRVIPGELGYASGRWYTSAGFATPARCATHSMPRRRPTWYWPSLRWSLKM